MRISDWSSDVCSSDRAIRLDRMTQAIGRVDRDTQVILETLALFIRFELSIQVPLAENDHAGRALAAKRFEAFVNQVGRHLASGRRTLIDTGAAAMSSAPSGERPTAMATERTRQIGRASGRERVGQYGE